MTTTPHNPPVTLEDVIGLKQTGHTVTCTPEFEINEVDFTHLDNEFQAVLFFCRYEGEVDGEPYQFRKCYARGCPHNLCPHVSQAVMIANRYLRKDYQRLAKADIKFEEKLFSLDDMVVKFQDFRSDASPTLTVEDYLHIAREGNPVSIEVHVEYLPAVENFGNKKEKRTFLLAGFTVESLGATHETQRCFACFATAREPEEKPRVMRIANDRLSKLYAEFDEAGITYQMRFFN